MKYAMKIKLSYILLVFIPFLGCTQNQTKDLPRSYVAHKTTTALKIDGRANEADWQKAKWSETFIDIEGVVEPTYKTKVKMLWDEKYYYILAEIEEPHVWATLKQRDTVIFYNNDFEVFFDPDGDTHNYYEYEMNALNTTWDLFVTKPYREKNAPIVNDWNIDGLKSAVQVNGTLNDPTDTDKGWTIELAFPWSAFKGGYYEDNVPRDDFWRINFSRVNWQYDLDENRYSRKKDEQGKFLHEFNWVWSPQGVINMHEPEHWGYVFFSTQTPGNEVKFEKPIDDEIKRYLYSLYRLQNVYFNKNQAWASNLQALNATAFELNGKSIAPEFEVHSMGYTIKAISPFTNKTVIIVQDGKSYIK